MPEHAVLIAIGIVAVAAAFAWARANARRDTTRQLHRRFEVSRRATIVDRDVGPDAQNEKKPRLLYADGLVGRPDVIFRLGDRYIVGEYKSWVLRSHVADRERYQVMLYMGMLRARRPECSVEGRLVYRNATVHVCYDDGVYQFLLEQAPTVLGILRQAGR